MFVVGLVGAGFAIREGYDRPESDREAARPVPGPPEPEDRLRRQSAALMPRALSPLALGMPEALVRRRRPAAVRRENSRDPDATFLEEPLERGEVAIYRFARSTGQLTQVQVMSVISDHALLPSHLAEMVQRYDRPSGLFLCPDTGGVPTLRFLWRRSSASVADILLFYGDRVSATFFLASDPAMQQSFARSRCRPASLAELRDRFPLATVEQLRRASQ